MIIYGQPLSAGRGIAVREFPMKSGFGFADYLLYLDRKAAGPAWTFPYGWCFVPWPRSRHR
jgi:hypothetical protein